MDTLIGREVSHYRIREKLGGGGMGVIYRAEDLRLGRTVALKFLRSSLDDESARTRFLREAQCASKLDHPNICTIFEVDTTDDGLFIAMALYEGETIGEKLRAGPFEIPAAVDLALQVLAGLAHAHEQGLVHRDVKPANLIVTRRGEVKILDFGIARPTQEPSITGVGLRLGTPSYMSPEQVQGFDLDHRADLWAVGVLLYEMVSGQCPFRGDTLAVVNSIMTRDPEPLASVGTRDLGLLSPIVAKALSKELAGRYQSARDMARDLERLRGRLDGGGKTEPAARANDRPSIAVLPFTNLSSDPEQEYFCAGISEELITGLLKLPGLRVASRTSAFRFRGQEVDVRRIGTDLGVRTVLEGSVRTSGSRLRITAQLTEVHEGYSLWSERYDRERGDILEIQDEIASSIVETLRRTFSLPLEGGPGKRATESIEAFHAYLKGRHFWNRRTEEGIRKGIDSFREAIRFDPGYALAHAGLADCHILLAVYGAEPAQEVMPKAREAAVEALRCDAELAEARTALASVRSVYDWDWEVAREDFQRAIRQAPSSAQAHQWYAMSCLLPLRHFAEAEAELHLALELDPLSLPVHLSLAIQRFYARHYGEAAEQCLRALEIDPGFAMARLFLGLIQAQEERYPEALAELRRAAEAEHSSEVLAGLGHACGRAGERAAAEAILEELLGLSRSRYVSPVLLAQVCVGLARTAEALDHLDAACEQRAPELIWLAVRPLFDPLREEPRFERLLSRIGLSRPGRKFNTQPASAPTRPFALASQVRRP